MSEPVRPPGRIPGPRPWLFVLGAPLPFFASSGPNVFDTGELAAAAWQLGAGHPPGQPLHAFGGHVAVLLLPIGPIPWRIALLGSAGVLLAAWLAARAAARLHERLVPHGPAPSSTLVGEMTFLAVLLAEPVVRQVARLEVYGPALALFAVAWLAIVRHATAHDAARSSLRIAAWLAAMLLALHPVYALGAGLAVLVMLAASASRLRPWPRTLRTLALAAFAGLPPLLYLPVRGAAGAPTWGETTTPAGLWNYLRGAAYAHNLGPRDGALSEMLGGHAAVWLVGTGVACVGLLAALVRAPPTGFPLRAVTIAALAAALPALLQPPEPRNPDNVAWLGPGVLAAIVVGVAALTAIVSRAKSASHVVAATILVLLAAAQPASWPRLASFVRADAPALERLAARALDVPPPRALVVVETDFVAASWMMARAIEGARPDVALFVRGLATSSWHWRSLAAHPLFDGRPVRGSGNDARTAFVDGAVRRALGRVAVAVEPLDVLPVDAPEAVAGFYGVVDVRALPSPTARQPRDWDDIVRAGIGTGPHGDHEAVAAVFRHAAVLRARRLARRGRTTEALGTLRAALSDLPESELAGWPARLGPVVRAPAPRVDDDRTVLESREEVEREVALLLHACGEEQAAYRLLEARAARGDSLALLQIG
ncbi:MAG: DUF2723 domain-containing protein, partial [Myxococcota bacterium]|nr:DUF2723 domain-containing protein [Myxococcota bacterium]